MIEGMILAIHNKQIRGHELKTGSELVYLPEGRYYVDQLRSDQTAWINRIYSEKDYTVLGHKHRFEVQQADLHALMIMGQMDEGDRVRDRLVHGLFRTTTAKVPNYCTTCFRPIMVGETYLATPWDYCLSCFNESLRNDRVAPFLANADLLEDSTERRAFFSAQTQALSEITADRRANRIK